MILFISLRALINIFPHWLCYLSDMFIVYLFSTWMEVLGRPSLFCLSPCWIPSVWHSVWHMVGTKQYWLPEWFLGENFWDIFSSNFKQLIHELTQNLWHLTQLVSLLILDEAHPGCWGWEKSKTQALSSHYTQNRALPSKNTGDAFFKERGQSIFSLHLSTHDRCGLLSRHVLHEGGQKWDLWP